MSAGVNWKSTSLKEMNYFSMSYIFLSKYCSLGSRPLDLSMLQLILYARKIWCLVHDGMCTT